MAYQWGVQENGKGGDGREKLSEENERMVSDNFRGNMMLFNGGE